jgi:hypothetical protein
MDSVLNRTMRFGKKPSGLAVIAGLCLLSAVILVLWQSRTRTEEAPSGQMREASHSPDRKPRSKVDEKRDPMAGKHSLAEMMPDKGGSRRLSGEQIDAYVNSQNRNLASLLSAYRISGDKAFLKEALERFPNDPQTLSTALRLERDPGKRLEMIEAFKRADPDNAMANCLAARALLGLGRKDEAAAELRALGDKPYKDFTLISCQNDEEVYLASGFAPLEAKLSALYAQKNPHILEVRRLSADMAEMREAYRAAGDQESADRLLDIQMELGRKLQGGPSTIEGLVGWILEKDGLKDLDSEEASARLEEIALRKDAIQKGSLAVTELMNDPAVAGNDWLLYFDRVKIFGEAAANDWMVEKYPGR